MDLETMGKKLLEALALQGQIASTQTQLLGLQGEIAKAENDIKQSENDKALTLVARGRARDALDGAVGEAEAAKQQAVQATANLKSAKLIVGQAEEELARYSDITLSQLGKTTQQFQLAKQTIEAAKNDVLQELENIKEDLESRRAELKAEGIELNLGMAAPQPKTTIL